jgi:hypothetical protein
VRQSALQRRKARTTSQRASNLARDFACKTRHTRMLRQVISGKPEIRPETGTWISGKPEISSRHRRITHSTATCYVSISGKPEIWEIRRRHGCQRQIRNLRSRSNLNRDYEGGSWFGTFVALRETPATAHMLNQRCAVPLCGGWRNWRREVLLARMQQGVAERCDERRTQAREPAMAAGRFFNGRSLTDGKHGSDRDGRLGREESERTWP